LNNAGPQAYALRLQQTTATDTRTVYLPEFGRAVKIAEFDRPMASDDTETAQTVSYMDALAAEDANSPAVEAAAAAALEEAGLNGDSPAYEKACAVYWWLQRTIRYVPTPGTSVFVDQTLITPCAMLAMEEPIGDCPQFSMLAAAIFRVLGMDCLYVTIAADEQFPDQWSHVYNTVEVYPGQYLPFDSSNGPEPGAEYSRPFKRKVWQSFTPKGRSKETSAGMIHNFKAAAGSGGMRNQTLRRKMGDLVEEPSIDEQIAYINDLTESTYGTGDLMTGPGVALNNPALQIDSSSGSGRNIWATIAEDFTQIARPFIQSQTQQPYYITQKNGQKVLYNPATGSTINTGSSISPVWIGAGLLAVLLLAGGRR